MDTERLIRRLVAIKNDVPERAEDAIDELIQEINDETKTIVAPELAGEEDEEALQNYRLDGLKNQLASLERRFNELHDQIHGDSLENSIADRLGSVENQLKTMQGDG